MITAWGNTLPLAYHAALKQLKKYGEKVDCPDWNTERLETQICMNVITPLAEPMISLLSIADPKSLEQYRLEMLDGILDWAILAGKEPYTYHDRIMSEYDLCIEELKRSPLTTRAVINVRSFIDVFTPDPACLQHIQFMIRNGKLNMTVLFRSNDAVKATFMNAFALIMLQKKAADEIGVEVGSYTHIANSFHCYKEDYAMLDGYIKRMYPVSGCTVNYTGDDGWKEIMDEEKPEILAEMEELKKRNGIV